MLIPNELPSYRFSPSYPYDGALSALVETPLVVFGE